jgi:hypothetical protein
MVFIGTRSTAPLFHHHVPGPPATISHPSDCPSCDIETTQLAPHSIECDAGEALLFGHLESLTVIVDRQLAVIISLPGRSPPAIRTA